MFDGHHSVHILFRIAIESNEDIELDLPGFNSGRQHTFESSEDGTFILDLIPCKSHLASGVVDISEFDGCDQ